MRKKTQKVFSKIFGDKSQQKAELLLTNALKNETKVLLKMKLREDLR